MDAEPSNVVAEYKGIQIVFTADCKFVTLGTDDDKKYGSLRAIKKAIDARLTENKLLGFVRGIAEMVAPRTYLDDHAGDEAIKTLDDLIERARDIVGTTS